MSENEGKRHVLENIISVLKNLYDPEIPVNVYDLGLIYRIDIKGGKQVEIDMTLTTPGCPVAYSIMMMVEGSVREALGDEYDVKVNLVWDPPWSPVKVTEEGRTLLKELFGYDVVEEWLKKEAERK